MKTSTLNTENGDTLVVFVNDASTTDYQDHIYNILTNHFKGQDIRILLLPRDVDLTLIKSSNLADNYDADLRENNPALEEAWQAYQTIKGLTEK